MSECIKCLFYQDGHRCLFELQHKEQIFFSFKKGEYSFSEKQSLKGIYCIKEGTCLISKSCSNGKDQIIELLSGGTLLGIRSVLCEEQTNLKAKVITPMEVCFLPKEAFLKLIMVNNNFSLFVIKELANYIKRSDNKIVSMGQKTMHQRVAEIIIEMPNYFKTLSDGFIDIKLRREDLANLIGIATESLIRAISHFQKQGWIEIRGKQLNIIVPEKLEQFSQGHILM